MTAIERHHSAAVAHIGDHYLEQIPAIAEQLARSSMCPDTFKGKPADIAIVGYSLADNGLRLSINTLPQCYVVNGRPGYMAQIQQAMAAMHGVTIRPVSERCDEKSATVEVLLTDGSRHEVTFTMAEAVRAGLDKKQGDMYRKWPANMLVARATTRAISWYCPAVKLGLAGTVNLDELDAIDVTSAEVDRETGEIVGAGEDVPRGEPLIDETVRADLLAAIGALDDAVRERLKAEVRQLGLPNLRSERVTRAHGALLARLLADMVDEA